MFARLRFIVFKIGVSASVLLSSGLMAQQNQSELDSLMTLLPNTEGAKRIEVLNDLPRLLVHDKPEDALAYTKEAMTLSKATKNEKQIAYSHFNFGRYYFYQGELDSSMYHHRIAMDMRRGMDDPLELARSLNGIGAVFDASGELDSALVYYFNALDMVNELEEKEMMSTTLNNIAVVYHMQGKYDLAIEYLKRSLQIDIERGEEDETGYTLSNIGSIYTILGEADSAIVYHKRALEIRERLNLKLEISRSLNGLANVYQEIGEREEAARYFLRSLELKRTVGNDYEVAVALNNLGDLYNSMGRHKEALVYLLEGRDIVDTLQVLPVQGRNFGFLATAYAGIGNYEQAYAYTKKLQKAEDSLQAKERDARVDELIARFESMQKEKRIVDLEKEKAEGDLTTIQLRTRLYFVVGVLVIAILLVVLILSRFLQNRRSNQRLKMLNSELEARSQEIEQKNEEIRITSQELERKNQEITKMNSGLEQIVDERTQNLRVANQELDLFLYQTSHALRGPLMRIMGLFSIIRHEEDPKMVVLMNEKVDYTIKSMDRMLHKLMDVTEIQRRNMQPEEVNLRELVKDHVAEIETEMQYDPSQMNLSAPNHTVMITEKYTLNVILRNLLENALHFRMPGRPHVIDFEIQVDGEEMKIRVRDNGMGIPKEQIDNVFNMFHRATEKSPGMGLGLYVMRKALEALGGEAKIESVEGEFTEVRVVVPILAIAKVTKQAKLVN